MSPERLIGGKYRLRERLGEGAHGAVFSAVHVDLQRTFAVKLMPVERWKPRALARFRREAEALGRLRHPNVVEITDFGVDAGDPARPFLVMEYLEGPTLAQHLATRGALPWPEAFSILRAIAAAVDHAAERGVLHRDLKPANVVLSAAPDGPRAKVVDFGVAGLLAAPGDQDSPGMTARPGPLAEASLTLAGDLVGTPLYAAPEVIQGHPPSRSSDVYSFGVLAYETIVGSPPFPGSAREALHAHVASEVPDPSREGAVPPALGRALRAALAKDPAQRSASAGDVVAQLERAHGKDVRSAFLRREWPRRSAAAAGVAAAGAGLALALMATTTGRTAEAWTYDARAALLAPRAADPRLLLVSLDQAALQADSRPLADRADEFGFALARLLGAGSRGVAVDLILPQSWSHSRPFQDALLNNPGRVVLAAAAGANSVEGAAAVHPLTVAALGPRAVRDMFGLVNVPADEDGRVRRGRLAYLDVHGQPRPSWAARTAALLGPVPGPPDGHVWLDPALDRGSFQRVSWTEVGGLLQDRPGLFRDRLVLMGAEFGGPGDDLHRVTRGPFGGASVVSGLALQAMAVDSLLRRPPLREAGGWGTLLAACAITIVLAAWCLLTPRPGRVGFAALALVALYGAGAAGALRWAGLVLPVVPAGLTLLAGLALAMLIRRQLPRPPEEPHA
jgi:CHASE2 domain-containing sensor protein